MSTIVPHSALTNCPNFCVCGAWRFLHGGGRRLRRTTDALGTSWFTFLRCCSVERVYREDCELIHCLLAVRESIQTIGRVSAFGVRLCPAASSWRQSAGPPGIIGSRIA